MYEVPTHSSQKVILAEEGSLIGDRPVRQCDVILKTEIVHGCRAVLASVFSNLISSHDASGHEARAFTCTMTFIRLDNREVLQAVCFVGTWIKMLVLEFADGPSSGKLLLVCQPND